MIFYIMHFHKNSELMYFPLRLFLSRDALHDVGDPAV